MSDWRQLMGRRCIYGCGRWDYFEPGDVRFCKTCNDGKATIYLSNWSSHKTPRHHGPGRKWTIMARPRKWELGEGTVGALVPALINLQAVRAGDMDVTEYRRRFMNRCAHDSFYATWLVPGRLTAQHAYGAPGVQEHRASVADGDTLCCACSRAAAAKGECHRVWAAELLRRAGWRVVLDGKELS